MKPTSFIERARDLGGALASAGFTGAVFGCAPFCALLWWLGGGEIVELVVEPMGKGPPVAMQWQPMVDLSADDFDGEGGDEDGPVEAGPDPTVASAGSGKSSEVADGGDEGKDEESLAKAKTAAMMAMRGPRQGPTGRKAKGSRSDGANGYSAWAAAHRSGAKRRRGKVCKDNHPDVQVADEDELEGWVVNRGLIEYYTSNFKRFNSLGWSGPYSDQMIKGWKIGGFGCNSPLYHAGLRRGDIVLTVNGKNTRTWLQIFGAYARLKTKERFEVVVIRRGERKVMTYRLEKQGPPTIATAS